MGFFGQYFKAAAVRSPQVIYVAALAGAAVPASGALAGEWRTTPRATVSTIVSDNANGATDRLDRNSDVLTTASPGIGISGSGGRSSLNLNYAHTRFMSFQDTADQSATNTLAANGQVEVWDRVTFIDASTSMTRQVIDSARATPSVDTGGEGGNRTTVQTASLQPFFLHHFGTWLETESRTRLDVTRTKADAIADTNTVGESFSFNSGRRFSVFTFSGLLVDDKTSRGNGAPATRERTATTNFRLRVLPTFSLLSSVGWESIHDPSLTEEPSGITWNGGFAWQPNSRSSMELTYGIERQTQTISFESNYSLSSRTSISASYSEQLTSSQEQLNQDLGFLVDNGAGVLIDSRTGEIFDATNPNFDFQTSLFRQQVLTVALTASRRLVNYGASVDWERRTTDSTGIKEQVISGRLSASRPFNSRLSGNAQLNFSFRDFGTDDQRVDRVGSLRTGLSYVLTQKTNLGLDYVHSVTRSTEGANNFHDNTVTLSLTHTF